MDSSIFSDSHSQLKPPLERSLLDPDAVTAQIETTRDETSSLIDSRDRSNKLLHDEMEDKLAQICATFLTDYENSRKTTLFSDSDYISYSQLQLYKFNSSFSWQLAMFLGTASFFISSAFEGNECDPADIRNMVPLTLLNIFGILVYCADIGMESFYSKPAKLQAQEDSYNFTPAPIHPSTYRYRKKKWNPVLLFFFFTLFVEMIIFLIRTDGTKRSIWTSALKPVVFLYYSSKTRDAVKALRPTIPIVLQVIVLEMFMTFMFSVIAYNLFGNANLVFSEFKNLQESFISMFELSTTVVNPSIWLRVYAVHKTGALFFVFFLIVMVFYMHSLVLTVVFKSYMKSIATIRKRKALKKEFVLQVTFETLSKVNRYNLDFEGNPHDTISTKSLKKTLRCLRPHYTNAKILSLIDIVDPSREGQIDMQGFQARLPKALKLALRNKRKPNQSCAIALDVLTACLTLTNLIYVIGISFVNHHMLKIEHNIIILGFVITFLGALDLFLRINPFHLLPSGAAAKFDYVFDSISCIATLFSIYSLTRTVDKIRYLMIGRAIDMFRFTQFFPTFRDIIKTSGNVISLVLGPLILVVFVVHVYCYIGIFLWGGLIVVGTIDNIEPFYDYLNFNTYLSGLLTMFQVLVVNDWNKMAQVFRTQSSDSVVFIFFISAITICVTILLNAFLSFFIAAFETEKEESEPESFLSFGNITTGFIKGKKKSLRFNSRSFGVDDIDSDDSSIQELNVYERQDVDEVLRRVTGEENEQKFTFKDVSDFLDAFANLTAGAIHETGYLLYNRNTSNRHENLQFKLMTRTFMDNEELHNTICGMIVEILENDVNISERIERMFESDGMPGTLLEIVASPLQEESPMILFVTRIKNGEINPTLEGKKKKYDEPKSLIQGCAFCQQKLNEIS